MSSQTIRSLLCFCIGLLWVLPLAAAPVVGYRIIATYPHATDNYTEGLFYRDGMFYEGTGREGDSRLVVTDPATGKVLQQTTTLPSQFFGEGIVDWGANLYQWTWQTHAGFVYDRFSLQPIRRFTYEGEGWGMTRSSQEIITSDGSAKLSFRDPITFKVRRTITVRDGGRPVTQLNELEFIKGAIYANVWHSDRIARISPATGRVLGWIDLTGILPADQRRDSESVLNGIAYDAKQNRIFVTGKNWPKIFEIQAVPRITTTGAKH
ncbi:glutaminyl-peptide cyclotransferase [Terriglobus albidus]|uniref:Glutaminyl-peptide cyclotransferase n=1 Tax=Terriglobus albidus TaxID=1592106 RepID=A0A5B9EFS5_9BACT|nr:glutaminyl-peptide cyclotransferase [Terriglobus albidus]QEE30932.1 glutaminyl-peptide cyclotransferase [Terriglobus albidus]